MNKLRKFLTIGVMVMTIVAMSGAFMAPKAQAAASAGDLIKMAGNSSVYYLGSDNKRYVFPNESTYFSWYKDFSGVVTIPATELQSYMLGGNVTMRPGTKLVKITTDPSVYAVEPNGTLRKIQSEADAITLFGSNWAKKVVDVADSFFTNYTIGTPLTSGKYPVGSLLKNANSANVYYYDGTNYRLVASEAAFNANRFDGNYIVTTTLALTAGGNSITTSEFTNTAQNGGSGPIITGSGLTVALAGDTPASMSLPKGATNVVFTKFNVTAANDGDITINSIKVKRTGIGAVTEISNVYLYDGATRLTSGRSITSDTNTAEFTLNYKVTRGMTKTLSIVANINGTLTAAGSHAFGLESASAISSTGATVSGSFPITGNLMSISTAVSASTAVVDQVSASWNVKVGSLQSEVAKMSVVAGANDVKVKSITLRNGGTLSNSYLQNLKLSVNSVQVATAVMSGDKAVFLFDTPFSITKGQQKNFSLTADITGGRTTDNIKFYIDETSDVNVEDAVYNVGAQVTNNFALGDQIVSLEGGDITMSDNGPSNTTYSVNTTNKDLLKIGVNSQRNVTVRKVKVTIDFGGTFAAADFARLKNIRIVDTSTGSTLVGPVADLTASNWSELIAGGDGDAICNAVVDGGCYAVLTDTFDIAAGTTRNLAIQADFDTSLTSGSTFIASMDLGGASYIYDNDSGEYVLATKVVPGLITGKMMTVNASNVDITKSSTPSNATFVKGATVDALGVSFNTTIADPLKLNKFTARIYADATAATFANAGYGDTAANTIVESASLYDGTTLVKGPVGLTLVGTIGASGGYYKADFTNLAYTMAAGSSKKLTVQLKLRNSFTGTKYVAVDVEKGDLEIENTAGNLLTGLSGNLNLAGAPSPVITALQNGVLTVAVDGNTPSADIATTGTAGVDTVKYRFSAADEAFDIVGMKLINWVDANTNSAIDDAVTDANVAKVTLSYVDASGATVTKDGYLSGQYLTFADGQLGIRVPKDTNTVVTIKVDTNTISGGATSNSKIKLGLVKNTAADTWLNASGNLSDDFIAQGVSSGQKIYGNTNSVTVNNNNVNALTVAKTKVIATNNRADGSSTVSANNLIGIYRFTSSPEAGSNQNSTLKKATIQLSGSMVTTGADSAITVRFYNSSSFDSNHLMGTQAIPVTGTGVTTATEATLTAYNEFNGTQDVYVVVDSTDANLTPAGTGTKSLSSSITTYKWDDGTSQGAATVPVTGVPVVGSTNNYSF